MDRFCPPHRPPPDQYISPSSDGSLAPNTFQPTPPAQDSIQTKASARASARARARTRTKTPPPTTTERPATPLKMASDQAQPVGDDWPLRAGPSAQPSVATGNKSFVGPEFEDIPLDDRSLGTDPIQPIRRGPRLRHDRLQRSETIPTTRALFKDDEPATLNVDALSMRTSQVYVGYSLALTFASSMFMVACATFWGLYSSKRITVNDDYQKDKIILMALTIVGVIGTIAFGYGFFRSCRTYFKKLNIRDGNNSWIEMTHRDRPLPALPPQHARILAGHDMEWNDRGENSAWKKMYSDEVFMRRYVQGLESRFMTLKGLPDIRIEDTTGPNMHIRDALSHHINSTRGHRTDNAPAGGSGYTPAAHRTNFGIRPIENPPPSTAGTEGSLTPKPSKKSDKRTSFLQKMQAVAEAATGHGHPQQQGNLTSISSRNLLAESDTETIGAATVDSIICDICGADGHDSHHHDDLTQSETQASIMTELCAGVTQTFSPLDNQSARNPRASTISTIGKVYTFENPHDYYSRASQAGPGRYGGRSLTPALAGLLDVNEPVIFRNPVESETHDEPDIDPSQNTSSNFEDDDEPYVGKGKGKARGF